MIGNLNPPKNLLEFFQKESGFDLSGPPPSLDEFNRVVQFHPNAQHPFVRVPVNRSSIAEEFLVRNYQLCLKFEFIPLFSHDIRLCIAMTHPWNKSIVKDIMRAFNVELKIVCVPETNFEELKSLCYTIHGEHVSKIESDSLVSAQLDAIESWNFDRARPRAIVEQMLHHAFACDASDVHLDVLHDRLRVRFRINGVLDNQPPIHQNIASDVIRAFKSFAQIPTDVKTAFSSNARLEIDGNPIDFRVEFQPTAGGGAIVLRILDNTKWQDPKWRQLPFSGNDLDVVSRILSGDKGLILVTGPTGSGKTTTLLRCLLHIGPENRVIRTIEHPVEYQLPNVTHLGVFHSDSPDVPSFSFKDGLRSHMRADPDVILVGEIRDLETAEAALDGALTGHLLLSTLHTMDAVSSVERMLEIGIDPWRLQSTLRLIIAQRLVPLLCNSCRHPLPVTSQMAAEFDQWGIQVPESHYVADGCPECGDRGIFGRTAIVEVLDLSDDLAQYVSGESLKDLHLHWRRAGGRTLYESALQLVAEGKVDFRTALAYKSRADPFGV